MSRDNGSSVISVALFLAILIIVLPVSALNATPTTTVTVAENTTAVPTTTVTVTQNTTAVPTTTVTVTQNATAVPTTTVTTTQTANATLAATTAAVTPLTTVVTTANPTISETKTETTGSVMVYSSPTGATILIDGVYAGTTPGNVNGVPAGNHILRLELSGYYNYEGSIYVLPGQTAQGYGTLQPVNQVTSAAPAPTAIIPVIVPVATASPDPTQAGLLGNTTVLTAIIGAIAVIIGSAATIFTHVKPPKKE
jgi:hypothetical protein